MLEKNVLSEDECNEIINVTTKDEKVERFLDWIIGESDEKQYDQFLTILSQTGQKHVVNYLTHDVGENLFIGLNLFYAMINYYDIKIPKVYKISYYTNTDQLLITIKISGICKTKIVIKLLLSLRPQ